MCYPYYVSEVIMKIKIKDLEANPFRDIKNYPMEEERIQGLMNSIKETGFWDNIPVRKVNNKYQIAYGHHRLEALRRLKIQEINVPIKSIGDEDMIRIMANENDELWGLNPKVDDETIKVARKYLDENPKIKEKSLKKFLHLQENHRSHATKQEKTLSGFLGKNWYPARIHNSLERLKLYDERKLSRKAINILPTEGTARSFVKAVKEIEPDLRSQEKVAKKIAEANKSEGLTSPSTIQHELLQEKLIKQGVISEKKKKDRTKDFLEYIDECTKAINSISGKLIKLIDFKKEFDSDFYRQTFESHDFIRASKTLIKRLEILINKENKNEEKIKKLSA